MNEKGYTSGNFIWKSETLAPPWSQGCGHECVSAAVKLFELNIISFFNVLLNCFALKCMNVFPLSIALQNFHRSVEISPHYFFFCGFFDGLWCFMAPAGERCGSGQLKRV